MKLDYGTMISPDPIVLNVGTIRKPLLCDVSKIGFDQFGLYEGFLSMTPETYYTKLKKDDPYWESLSEDEQIHLSLFDVIVREPYLQKMYMDIFQIFFEEAVDFQDCYFLILKAGTDANKQLTEDDIFSVIGKDMFPEVLSILKQICGMNVDEDEFRDIPESMFKNAKAKALYERMQRDKKKVEENKDANPNYSLPNIISAVSARHPSINYTNMWKMTIYQLLDSFNRLRTGAIYEIDQTRVSVWGDEKNTFRQDAWFKNDFDN